MNEVYRRIGYISFNALLRNVQCVLDVTNSSTGCNRCARVVECANGMCTDNITCISDGELHNSRL